MAEPKYSRGTRDIPPPWVLPTAVLRLAVLTNSSGCGRLAAALSVSVLVAVLTGCQGLESKGGGEPVPHGSLSVSPSSLSFGKVIVGQSASLQGSLRATGATANISSVTGTNGDFGLKGASFPASLEAGQSLSFTITFTPQVSGAASTSLSFASSADDSPALQSESGTGTPAPQHNVDLSWNASKGPGVVGYNVYRKVDKDYSRINDGLDTSTNYKDETVLAGGTYYYVVTAVDNNGIESVPSKPVTAVIPTP
jgi:Abnormal spindle-like microcephaly-assoc'd, ASPM-SPD-2-Hydin